MDLFLAQNTTIQNQYRIIEKMGEGGMGIVYRAQDLKSEREVALKFLNPKYTSGYVEDIIRFRREVESVSKLDHPNIVRMFGSGDFNNTPYFVTELMEGVSLSMWMEHKEKMSIENCVNIIKAVAQALDYVHNKGIIHRDVKPSNIYLVETDKGIHIKLIDFGVALVMELSEIKEADEVVGTFGYMSPESTGIMKKPVDERSDLYSLGIVFYILLTGEMPFKSRNVSSLLHEQVATEAMPVRRINSQVSDVLEEIIKKLMSKEQDLRYQSAKGLIYDINRYLHGEKDFVIGSNDQKVKLTYQTRLVGREEEMEKIKGLIDQTWDKKGNICLIGGEPGVGKTRLVEGIKEYIYNKGYEKGGLFIEGRCVSQENKTPYQPLRDAMNEYIRKVEKLEQGKKRSEMERIRRVAGELGEIIVRLNPNMRELLGQTPVLTPLDPEKENQRFVMTVANFFMNLAEEGKICVLFLDDLQWADEGTFKILEEMSDGIGQSHLIIIGTYRSNELRKDHRLMEIKNKAEDGRKSAITDFELKKFDKGKMNKLLANVLGEKEEFASDLTEYVLNKSGGNPFFAITILRELVERKTIEWKEGRWREDWEKINQVQILGNIVDMVLLRIKDLPGDVENLLKSGAVIGRKFELPMLYELMGGSESSIVNLVDEAISRQLLEQSLSEKGVVLFIHDRIREAFFKRMSPDELKLGHLKVGEVLEKKFNNNEEDVIFDLAYHFIDAGNEEKGLKYAILAGDKARLSFANQEAIKYFSYAKEKLMGKDLQSEKAMKVFEGLGDVLRLEGKYDEALDNFKQAIDLITEQLHKARVNQKMADTLFQMGKGDEAIKVAEETLHILKLKSVPKSNFIVLIAVFMKVIKHMIYRQFPFLHSRNKYKNNQKMKIAAAVYCSLGLSYFFIDIMKLLYNVLSAMNLSYHMKETREFALTYIIYSSVDVSIGKFQNGIDYLTRALDTAIQIKDKTMEGFAYDYFAYLYHAANQNDKAIESAKKAIEILSSIGERWEIAMSYAFLCWPLITKGEIIQLRKYSNESLALMQTVNDPRTLGWSLMFVAAAMVDMQGPSEETLQIFKKANECEIYSKETPHIVNSYSFLMYDYEKTEKFDEAIKAGETGIDIFLKSPAKGHWSMHIFARTAQCYLSKIEQQNITGKGKKNILKRVKILLDFAQKWGKMYQAFWGLALRVKGNYFWVMGKKKKADGFFVKAIDFSSENGHKQELAYAYYDYGRNLLKDSGKSERLIGKARECLSKARDIFIKIGAAPAADMAGELLCIKPGTQTSMSENTHSSEDLSTQDRLSIERRMETVLDTSRYLSSILDLNELLEKIMDKTIELVGAERGIVFLNQKDKKSEGHLTARVLRNIDKEDPSIKAIQEAVAERVMKEKKPFIIEDASLDKEMTAISTRSSRVNGLKSMLCAPIIAKNEVLGVIYLDNHLVTGLFNLKDMSVLEMIAGQAGVSIENAILYQNLKEQERLKSEMAIAEKIQTSLAPVIPLHPDLEITAVMRPAEEVGGDYYDIIEDNQKNLWFAIGDVTGHGVTPGLIMMMAQSSFSTVIKAKKDLSPKTALMEVNSTLFENITNRLHESQNMTMKFVKYLGNGSFIYANAAHPDIFIYRKRTGTCELLSMPSTFLGFLPDISDSIDESSFSLESGDIMLLYSDGITESRKREDDSLWGEEKMQEILIQSAHLGLDSVRDKILNEAMEWCENRPRDDMTLLLVKRK